MFKIINRVPKYLFVLNMVNIGSGVQTLEVGADNQTFYKITFLGLWCKNTKLILCTITILRCVREQKALNLQHICASPSLQIRSIRDFKSCKQNAGLRQLYSFPILVVDLIRVTCIRLRHKVNNKILHFDLKYQRPLFYFLTMGTILGGSPHTFCYIYSYIYKLVHIMRRLIETQTYVLLMFVVARFCFSLVSFKVIDKNTLCLKNHLYYHFSN